MDKLVIVAELATKMMAAKMMATKMMATNTAKRVARMDLANLVKLDTDFTCFKATWGIADKKVELNTASQADTFLSKALERIPGSPLARGARLRA
jgi:hypothetical protein